MPAQLARGHCEYYAPKDTQDVLILEAERNLVRLRQDLLLTDEEREELTETWSHFQEGWVVPAPADPWDG